MFSCRMMGDTHENSFRRGRGCGNVEILRRRDFQARWAALNGLACLDLPTFHGVAFPQSGPPRIEGLSSSLERPSALCLLPDPKSVTNHVKTSIGYCVETGLVLSFLLDPKNEMGTPVTPPESGTGARRPVNSAGSSTSIGIGVKGCAFCVEFCPPKVLTLSETYNTHGYHPPYLINEQGCTGCDLCGLYCPDFAIYSTRVPLTWLNRRSRSRESQPCRRLDRSSFP